MPAVEAKIVYETGKTTTNSIEVVMEQYKKRENSNFAENQQCHMTIQQKNLDELSVDFYILTYSNAVLKSSGEYESEKIEDARKKVSEVKKLMQEVGELHRQPICRVQWGEEQFCGILSKLDYRYTMFLQDGTPVRVSFQAIFREIVDVDSALQNDNTPQSPDRSKYRLVYEKTQLYQMAYLEYNDPSKWRVIAEANEINDPLDIVPGMLLSLPPSV